MSVTTYGSLGTVRSSFTYDRARGRIEEFAIRVRHEDAIGVADTLFAQGFAPRIDPDGQTPFSLVRYSAVGQLPGETSPDILRDTWELEASFLEKSLWSLPGVMLALSLSDDPRMVAYIRKFVERMAAGEIEIVSPFNGETFQLTKDQLTTELASNNIPKDPILGVLMSLSRDQNSWMIPTPVLRRDSTYPANTNISPAFANMGKMFTTAGLLVNEPTIPQNIRQALPEGFWQKQTPIARQQKDATWDYTVSYVWAESYDEFIYGTPVA